MTRRKLSQLQIDSLVRVMRAYPWFAPRSDDERVTLTGLWLLGILDCRRDGSEHQYRLSSSVARALWRSLP